MAPKKGKKTTEKKKVSKSGPDQPGQLVEKLQSVYEKLCAVAQNPPCGDLCQAMNKCVEENTLLTRVILQGDRTVIGARPLLTVEPLLQALRDVRYVYLEELRLWNIVMPYEMIASVSLLLERRIYVLRHLELIDCLLEAESLRRLAPAVTICPSLTTLTLDHNEFGDEGCKKLCNGLQGNMTLVSLSMTYCDLGVESGSLLGDLVVKTAIRNLFLDGNSLQCEGVIELVKVLADRAELESFDRVESSSSKKKVDDGSLTAISSLKVKERDFSASDTESRGIVDSDTGSKKSSHKKKKGKKKKSAEPPGPPLVGPWIRKLHLVDNGIDMMGTSGLVGPINCTQLLGTLLQHSVCLEELDLDVNLIGDMAGRQILAALEARAAGGLSSVKVRTTHRMKSDTFNGIFKLGAGLKKKKKGKKKKKK